ncbi:hypothetical protein FZEAL_8707 [Fusarium zealandicum]|uniref:C2H2-type domain-containing protein n=1 Tax=Fusarium zealandicum TaxID=1053134 RepID=A0A8H4XGL1_9HYPO|nr:hypothetical protein FZEAL_8707 [Fusarium zealandicum]
MRAPDHRIRAVLLALCSDSKVKRRALEYCDALQSADASGAQTETAATSVAAGTKRKATSDLFVCVQCDETFTSGDNNDKECAYHWGELEVDDSRDFWADHDENCHGIIDTEEMRDEYPEGFIWSCCDQLGNTTGCKFGRHESHPDKSKRETGSEPLSSEDDDDDDNEHGYHQV